MQCSSRAQAGRYRECSDNARRLDAKGTVKEDKHAYPSQEKSCIVMTLLGFRRCEIIFYQLAQLSPRLNARRIPLPHDYAHCRLE